MTTPLKKLKHKELGVFFVCAVGRLIGSVFVIFCLRRPVSPVANTEKSENRRTCLTFKPEMNCGWT